MSCEASPVALFLIFALSVHEITPVNASSKATCSSVGGMDIVDEICGHALAVSWVLQVCYDWTSALLTNLKGLKFNSGHVQHFEQLQRPRS